MPIAPGTRIGRFEVVGWLGAGGMGEVYRARDASLGRDVAIKVLPESFAANATRIRRFEQEARAVGQLTHPNIVAVHDVGIHAGAPYIVSELLEGESLRNRLQAGALSPRKALDVARQIAEGLAAAHDRGIVHRDLKPDNLFLINDGRVKILDFGVAKLTLPTDEATGSVDVHTETAAGILIGTVRYMSPEQVRGEPVDARSDIFSVGIVLHEMLTGRSSFTRETPAETMAAILKEDPPSLAAETPAPLARIVLRCLEKTREARFQSARDLAFALEVLSGSTTATAPALSSQRRWGQALIPAVVVLTLAAAAGWLMTRGTPDRSDQITSSVRPENDGSRAQALATAKFTRFTDWEGTEALAEISPDGRFVAFLADREGHFDIWLSQVGTGEFRNLTPDLPAMNPPGVVLRPFGFSGDGSKIWFSLSGNPGDRKMLMPLLGGKPWAFLGDGDITPSWSPDGNRLAYVNNGQGDPIFVADATGADARQILAPERNVLHNHDPVWSPDGQWLYFLRGLEPTDQMNIWRLQSSGGAPERLTDQRATLNFLAPLDAGTLLYVGRAGDRTGPWLWALDVASKRTRRVSWGLEHYTSVATSRDGRRIVVTIANPTVSLWTAPISDRQAEDEDIRRYQVPTVRALAPRFSGTALFYLAAGSTGDGLWRLDGGQSSEVWRGGDGVLSEPAAISPDGSRVALVIGRAGKRHLAVMAADGTNVRTLGGSIDIQGPAGQSTVDWSIDGTWLVTGGRDAEGPGLFRIPADGSPPIRLVAGQATNPVRSPDGRLIAYSGAFVGGQAHLLAIRPDGTPLELPRVPVRQGGYRFVPSGTAVVYLSGLQSRDFSLLNLVDKTTRQITRFSNQGQLATFDITPDGKQIVFDRSRENSDIVLIEVAK